MVMVFRLVSLSRYSRVRTTRKELSRLQLPGFGHGLQIAKIADCVLIVVTVLCNLQSVKMESRLQISFGFHGDRVAPQ